MYEIKYFSSFKKADEFVRLDIENKKDIKKIYADSFYIKEGYVFCEILKQFGYDGIEEYRNFRFPIELLLSIKRR